MSNFEIVEIVLHFIVSFIIFMLLRGLVLWYWKVNEFLKIQQEQTEYLKKIYTQLGGKEAPPEENEEL